MTAPKSVSDVDEQLRDSLKEAHRSRWYAVGAVFALLVAVVTGLAVMAVRQQGVIGHQQSVLARQQSELEASCGWWRSLAPLPVTVTPPATRPGELGVSLIAGARVAYDGQHCPGPIPPAAPSLVTWAAFYHLRYR